MQLKSPPLQIILPIITYLLIDIHTYKSKNLSLQFHSMEELPNTRVLLKSHRPRSSHVNIGNLLHGSKKFQIPILTSQYSPKDQISSIEHKFNFQRLCNKFPNHQRIYTDASKNDQAVGAAVVYDSTIQKIPLPKASSIFTAEAWAVFEALKYMQDNNNNLPFIIFTDSMSVIKAIVNPIIESKHEVILNIHYTYTNLNNIGNYITLAWVPSHQGIEGNELADKTAKEATLSSPVNSCRQIPYQDLIVAVRHIERQAWNKEWRTSKPNSS
ncbi:uncharacterized protein LOC105663964 [Megachile rotundata]|uniref:uncharacterized protein LOC105663964 n=1 Tax=Megachile rotundata TaxID=143995 RepID=UPI000614C1C8|nr:PREDICTED: uncharacterized protein LOC105663964 [Megachile rotundata]